MLILQRGLLFDNIYLHPNNISVSRTIKAYLHKFNYQYLNLVQYFGNRDMSSLFKQLIFPPMQNTDNSNQTDIQTKGCVSIQSNQYRVNNGTNTEQFQCHSMIDSITERLKGYLSENLGAIKHD